MQSYKNDVLHRLKIIRGHLDQVLRMVEDDRYCLEVLQQSRAVGSSLKKVEQLVLENHLRTCVKSSMLSQEDVEEKVDEIIKVFKVRR